MAITWAQARAKIRGDLWRPSAAGVPDDVCDRALHSSLLELEGERRWLWLEELTTPLTVAVQADNIDAPAHMRSVSTLSVIDGASKDALTLLSLARVRAMSQGATVGVPSFYALHDDKFYFDVLCAVGRQFELIGTFQTPEDLDAAVLDGDTNQTLQKQQQAVIANACHYAALSYLKNDAEATRQRAVYERILQRLMDTEDEARGDLHGGSIIPDTAYRDSAFGVGPR